MPLFSRAARGGCAIFLALTLLLAARLSWAVDHEETPVLEWQEWSDAIFEQAKKENKFVLLDLQAVWCHWCHVMEDTTYHDAKVIGLIQSKFIPVQVDQDAHPDISARYENWGWPATVVFSPEGSEIVKRRGYIPPEAMAALLEAIIKDPTPGPSVKAEEPIKAAEQAFLTPDQKKKLEDDHKGDFDLEYGGWGDLHKLVDADHLEVAMMRAGNGDVEEEAMAKKTLDAGLNLLDPEWGGFYQYSDAKDWKSPHYEKLISVQADTLRLYSLAYSTWMEPRYYEAARKTADYVARSLTDADGAFYVSQDADVDAQFNGYSFYSLKDEERLRLGKLPKVDTHLYARENGWMIRALAAFYDASGEDKYLSRALSAAQWVLANRRFSPPVSAGRQAGAGGTEGGFRHNTEDRAGPYLGDTLSMGQAFLCLYESTGDRQWQIHAENAADFIQHFFKKNADSEAGFFSEVPRPGTMGVFQKPIKNISENIQIARFANKLFRVSGRPQYRSMAEVAMRYLASPAVAGNHNFMTGTLLADRELGSDPLHVTVVGLKEDPKAKALHQAALGYPEVYRRVEWWDRREGPLPYSDVSYPELEEAAAFICAGRACSPPFFSPEKISASIELLRKQ